LQISEDIVVPVANDRGAFLRKKARAAFVCALLLRGMLPPVDFDGEPKAWAKEIKCEWSDRMLPSELQTIELAAAKCTPKAGFRIRHIFAQPPGTRRHQLCAREA
jgi:hypothetical protein